MFSVWKADEAQYAQGASVFRVYFYQKRKSMPEMLTNNPLETGRDTSEPISKTGAAQETNTAQNNDSAEPEHTKNTTRKLGRIISLGLMVGALLQRPGHKHVLSAQQFSADWNIIYIPI